MRVGILLSGSGSTARAIIEHQRKSSSFDVACLFSDNKESKARDLGDEFGIPVEIRDMAAFYHEHDRIDKKDMALRAKFDELTSQWLERNRVDVVALAGYLSLVTAPIFSKFITINSHPADLTVTNAKGARAYVGLHAVYDTIAAGEEKIRTSIILVDSGLDAGAILVRSAAIKLPQTQGKDELELRAIAKDVQEELKRAGDYPAYCAALDALAAGVFSLEGGLLHVNGKPSPGGMTLAS